MKIGIIEELKIPSDTRVTLVPEQCAWIDKNTNHEVIVHPSLHRCFSDSEYEKEGVSLSEDLGDCDLLLGVKEIPIDALIQDLTYMFFSHTIKKQASNRRLLQAILTKKITLIDYETLRSESGRRVIAFGNFAGMVGAHNAVKTYGSRTGHFSLAPMTSFKRYTDAQVVYSSLVLPALKIVLTGTGRVGNGSAQVLRDMGIRQVSAEEFLNAKSVSYPTFTQLATHDYVSHQGQTEFNKEHYYANPGEYQINFQPFYSIADIMINGIYWDNKAPAFFNVDEMKKADFKIQVIADVTCDIAPKASIPSTLRASTIDEPVFGFNPKTGQEEDPYQPDCIDVMSIDNLPNELPRDASRSFGEMFIKHVLPEINDSTSKMINNATITNKSGELTSTFIYLKDYAFGTE